MRHEKKPEDRRPAYEPPRIVASYTAEELEESLRPHGALQQYNGDGGPGGCGCGCGCGG